MASKTFKTNSVLDKFLGREQEENAIIEIKEETVITDPEEQEAKPVIKPTIPPAPEGYKINPLYVETRNRRVQLVMQQSVYDAMKLHCTAQGISINEYVHELIKRDLGD